MQDRHRQLGEIHLRRTAGPYIVPIATCAAANGIAYSITSSARASSVGGTVEAESLGGLEIDHQLELGRLQNWKVRRLCTFEYLTGVHPDLSVSFCNDCAISHQAAATAYSRNANIAGILCRAARAMI